MSVEMSQERVAQVEMLIRFFNMQAGTSYKVSIERNQKAVSDAIDRANGDIVMLKNYISDYVKEVLVNAGNQKRNA